MAGKKKNTEVVSLQKYKRKGHLNIGTILFGIIFVYLVFTVLIYFTKDRVSVYEVREGSILKDRNLTGMVLRKETVVNAEKSGYVNYFVDDAQKVALGTNIYTITSSKLETQTDQDSNEEVSLNADEWNSILLKAQGFNESYSPEEFKTASNLKSEVTAILQNNTTQSRVAQLNSILQSGNVDAFQSPDDGIVELSVDGYENLTTDNITDEMFDKANYSVTELSGNQKIDAGQPVYRLVTDEEWTVTVRLTSDLAQTFQKKMNGEDSLSVEVRFLKDNKDLWGTMRLTEKKNDIYANITFKDSMIRYADKRYLNVELILEDQSGLKIPKSSVIKKSCYAIPQDYITTGGNSSDSGVMIQDKDSAVFQQVEIYYVSDDGTNYVNPESLKVGTTLIKPESSETMTVEKTAELSGVYNINQGYAVFNAVEILCESDEYYIIKEDNSYGLSNYDHIVQDGEDVKEDEVIF